MGAQKIYYSLFVKLVVLVNKALKVFLLERRVMSKNIVILVVSAVLFISQLWTTQAQADAKTVYIRGDVAQGSGELVIAGDLIFEINHHSDPSHLLFDWNTGFGSVGQSSSGYVDAIHNSTFVLTKGGSLDIDSNLAWTADKFVDGDGVQSSTLTSGPMLLQTGNNTRMFFSDSFQMVQGLREDGRNQMIVRAGVFELPKIQGFVLEEMYASSVQVRGETIAGFPRRSNIVTLSAPILEPQLAQRSVEIDTFPAPNPEPGTWMMMLAGFAILGFALRRRKIVCLV